MSRHDDLIQDQFSRQAKPFARVKWHNHDDLLDLILEVAEVGAGDRVLDAACGPGIVACAAAARGARVTGVDVVPAMIEEARKKEREAGLSGIDWRTGDVRSMPFAGSSFDRVLTRFSFHHFAEPAAVLKEMWRVAARGARVTVCDVYVPEDREKAAAYDRMETLRDPSHTRALPLSELMELVYMRGAEDVRAEFYRLEVDLDRQLASSFPNPGDDEKIREIFRHDLSENRMGVNPFVKDGRVHFSYPIVVVGGTKP